MPCVFDILNGPHFKYKVDLLRKCSSTRTCVKLKAGGPDVARPRHWMWLART